MMIPRPTASSPPLWRRSRVGLGRLHVDELVSRLGRDEGEVKVLYQEGVPRSEGGRSDEGIMGAEF